MDREFACMRCGQTSSPSVDVVGNLTTFWQGDTYGHSHPTLCRECIEDVRRFTETPIVREVERPDVDDEPPPIIGTHDGAIIREYEGTEDADL